MKSTNLPTEKNAGFIFITILVFLTIITLLTMENFYSANLQLKIAHSEAKKLGKNKGQ